MKKQILIGAALLASSLTFAQKDELKAAEKALKSGNTVEAKAALDQAQSAAIANPKYAAQYYFLRGKVYFDMASKGQDKLTSISEAAKAFDKVVEVENGKGKYSVEVEKMRTEAINLAVKTAQDTYTAQDYETSFKAFEQVYRLSPTDTLFLYNASLVAVQSKNYAQALDYYLELKKIGYDGSEVNFVATNKETGKEEVFPNKSQRDLMVKTGEYVAPKEKKTPSKKGEIIKNIALIYLNQGNTEKALEAFAEAKQQFPDDSSIIINEANIHLQLGNKDKFKELMAEAASKNPKNADLHYNIGVINMEQGNMEEARAAYLRALEVDPNYLNAILNYSTSYINEGNAVIDEMNSLGNSKADIAKYDKLKVKKDDLFKSGAKILEDYMAKSGKKYPEVLDQLKNIYGALGDNENYMRVKKLIEQ